MLKIVPNEPGETMAPSMAGFQGERPTEPQPRVGAEPLEKTLKRMFWHTIDPAQPTVSPQSEAQMSIDRMCKYGEGLISTLSEAERRLCLKYCEIEEDYLNDAREQAFIQGYLTAIQHMARCQKIVPDGEDRAG